MEVQCSQSQCANVDRPSSTAILLWDHIAGEAFQVLSHRNKGDHENNSCDFVLFKCLKVLLVHFKKWETNKIRLPISLHLKLEYIYLLLKMRSWHFSLICVHILTICGLGISASPVFTLNFLQVKVLASQPHLCYMQFEILASQPHLCSHTI